MSKSYATCPYGSFADDSSWRRAVAGDPHQLHLDIRAPFGIDRKTKIATAGSCFAQHVAKRLQKSGFTYFVTETCPKFVPPEVATEFNYGVFSARYGNLYTTRQLYQTLERAYGLRAPADRAWRFVDAYYDPFRPFIQPGGFPSIDLLEADRAQHARAIRRIVEKADVFVFTLGLTETWFDSVDGSIYPICPGCGAGVFEPDRHRFVNFGFRDVYDDLSRSLAFMWSKNPDLKVILTVSPVPLAATAEPRNVVVSTSYSKAVLRAVADEMVALDPRKVAYFPSYEIITGGFNRGAYFETDLRSVTEAGVDHVMRVFFANFAGDVAEQQQFEAAPPPEVESSTICDEEIAMSGAYPQIVEV